MFSSLIILILIHNIIFHILVMSVTYHCTEFHMLDFHSPLVVNISIKSKFLFCVLSKRP